LLITRWSQPASLAAFAALASLALGVDPAAGEFQAALYGGFSESFDSDIALNQPNGTNMRLNSVPWDGASFDDPPYWGTAIVSARRGIESSRSRPSSAIRS
jgi:hypothetical protein